MIRKADGLLGTWNIAASVGHQTNTSVFLPQAVDDVVSDRFPLSLSEAVYLAGLRAQVVLGPYSDRIDLVDYR